MYSGKNIMPTVTPNITNAPVITCYTVKTLEIKNLSLSSALWRLIEKILYNSFVLHGCYCL